MTDEPPAPPFPFKPGEAYCGRGVQQTLDVIRELADAGIPSVVAGVKALVYYGAKRCPTSWEICVPDHLYDKASMLFDSAPLKAKYDSWPKIMPQPGTMIHTFPRFTLKGVNFFFYISPLFEHRIDCNVEKCEKSMSGVPYPKLEVFAQGLLETQRFHDLDDLVDGMNLTEEWGLQHLDFSGSGLENYYEEKNKRIRESDSGSVHISTWRPPADLKAKWQKIVRGKEERIGFKLPKEKYETRFRIKGSGDPRLRNREV